MYSVHGMRKKLSKGCAIRRRFKSKESIHAQIDRKKAEPDGRRPLIESEPERLNMKGLLAGYINARLDSYLRI